MSSWIRVVVWMLPGCAPEELPGPGRNLVPEPEEPTEPTDPRDWPTDDDGTDTLPTDSGFVPTEFGVDVFWTANYPRSAVEIRVADPEGRTGWSFGMAETEAG
ncbi:MAG: hypothetical protein AAF211_28860, partial [Myxococcota bacterium]